MTMSPPEVRGLANSYRTEAGNFQEIISKMESLLQQLQGVWEGSACEACSAKFEELKPSFNNVVTLIEEIASGLDVSANTMEETDNALANQWR